MGSLIGGMIGGLGSLFGGSSTKSADNTASQQALTGFNYLNGNANNQAVQAAGTAATGAGAATQNQEADLLGLNGAAGSAAAQPGFNNYLNSTGYNFQKQQGDASLTGSAAARGLLGSGATGKALTSYGQNLASTTFNNYLGNLSGLNTQQQGTANAGTTASGQVGAAGNTGGGNASTATQAGAAANGNGIATGIGTIGAQAPNALNFFGNL